MSATGKSCVASGKFVSNAGCWFSPHPGGKLLIATPPFYNGALPQVAWASSKCAFAFATSPNPAATLPTRPLRVCAVRTNSFDIIFYTNG